MAAPRTAKAQDWIQHHVTRLLPLWLLAALSAHGSEDTSPPRSPAFLVAPSLLPALSTPESLGRSPCAFLCLLSASRDLLRARGFKHHPQDGLSPAVLTHLPKCFSDMTKTVFPVPQNLLSSSSRAAMETQPKAQVGGYSASSLPALSLSAPNSNRGEMLLGPPQRFPAANLLSSPLHLPCPRPPWLLTCTPPRLCSVSTSTFPRRNQILSHLRSEVASALRLLDPPSSSSPSAPPTAPPLQPLLLRHAGLCPAASAL